MRADPSFQPPELRKYYRNGLLDPIRISRAVCEEARIDLGSYGHAGQFQQTPAPDDGGLLKVPWFQRINWTEFFAMAGNQSPTWNFVSDGAFTKEECNDPCGLMAYTEFNNSLFIRKSRSRHLEQFEYEAWIEEFFKEEHGHNLRSSIYIEPKANGITTAQGLKRRSKLNVSLDTAPTRDKVARVKDIQPFVESGRVFLIARGGEAWVQEFIDEVKVFPNGSHDEHVDMLVMAINRIQQLQVTKPVGGNAPPLQTSTFVH